jgi:acyl carrier protein
VPGRFGTARNRKLAEIYSDAEIFSAIQAMIARQAKGDSSKVMPEAGFIQDLGCDSLGMVEIVMECEDRFGIEIGERTARRVKSVQDLVAAVKTALEAQKRRS